MYSYCLLRGGMTMLDMGMLGVHDVVADAIRSKAVLLD